MDSSTTSQAGHVVDLSIHFARIYLNVAANDAVYIDHFIDHVQVNGLENLKGRLKPSWDVPKDDPFWLKKVQFARHWDLWHYHLGMPDYDETNGHGDCTSQWVLHLRRHPDGNRTQIVDWDKHPPFALPDEKYFIMPGDEAPFPFPPRHSK
ncbi:hypothetical protein [Pseudomonas sp. B21-021]|uniref:hypothetical protein n=1 Tax=Pseudomonas sp. B21-021 TaxID=2895476 RepID=UPI00215EE6B4|nr:hypothetical protein [Pseudomonas sp. B21-021]UVM28782.1 hypothetical protein LOY31_06820 [Pseudomonas sp. B21-021]